MGSDGVGSRPRVLLAAGRSLREGACSPPSPQVDFCRNGLDGQDAGCGAPRADECRSVPGPRLPPRPRRPFLSPRGTATLAAGWPQAGLFMNQKGAISEVLVSISLVETCRSCWLMCPWTFPEDTAGQKGHESHLLPVPVSHTGALPACFLGPFPLAFHPSHRSGARRARAQPCPAVVQPSLPSPSGVWGPAPHPAEPDGRAAVGRAACTQPGQGVQGWRRLARLCRGFCRPKK